LSGKRSYVEGRERLLGIIDLCKSIESGRHDPFAVEIDDLLQVIKRYFETWESMGDRCLDAQAINHLATIVELQGSWVKDRSTSLYADPFLIGQKILRLRRGDLAEAFLKSWHPVLEHEQISPESLKAALEYWKNLLPLADRWGGLPEGLESELGTTSFGDLIKEELASEMAFDESIEALWAELKERYNAEGKIEYWDFIRTSSFSETVQRAYLASFLITYRYANLDVNPIEQEMHLSPNEEQMLTVEKRQTVSIPIPITYDKWMEGDEG
jgi:hypothetical protein